MCKKILWKGNQKRLANKLAQIQHASVLNRAVAWEKWIDDEFVYVSLSVDFSCHLQWAHKTFLLDESVEIVYFFHAFTHMFAIHLHNFRNLVACFLIFNFVCLWCLRKQSMISMSCVFLLIRKERTCSAALRKVFDIWGNNTRTSDSPSVKDMYAHVYTCWLIVFLTSCCRRRWRRSSSSRRRCCPLRDDARITNGPIKLQQWVTLQWR